jgi:adenylate cyclase
MKFRPFKLAPILVAVATVLLGCWAEWSKLGLFRRLEWITYDWRVRLTFNSTAPTATNLGAVFIDDESLRVINERVQASWPWPRDLHGLLVRDLAALGARRVAFDILFAELAADQTADAAFARELQAAGNVHLPVFGETKGGRWSAIPPAELFRTNCLALGHATSETDTDGVLRRAKPFKDDPRLGRIWHLGLLLAADELGLDLASAVVLPHRVELRGTNGARRVIPLDDEGFFLIDWSLAWNDPRLTKAGFEDILAERRAAGDTPDAPGRWAGKLVVVGSIGSGNNISDIGATPLAKESYLVGKHWNVANSLLTGRFVTRTGPGWNLGLILALGALSALLTWNTRASLATVAVLLVAAAYSVAAILLFTHHRVWLPWVIPVGVGLVLTHVTGLTYRLVFEERERRRVRGIFSKLVSPEVVTELLAAENLHLGGARRHITVFFADVRGFTEMTDSGQARAEEYARANNLTPEATEAHLDAHAAETLETVNSYLATIADQIKKHGGTLDKYIGDCVMAFWGAPGTEEHHAVKCVRAAIDAQRAIYELNRARHAENQRRDEANRTRGGEGEPLLPLLPLLTLGTGINTGNAIVGLMGSDAHILNYTVFGREVNLASRLEVVSGRGRIIIGEATYKDLQRDDPALAAKCVRLAPVLVKGIQRPVPIFEVPWKPEAPPAPVENPNPETRTPKEARNPNTES